ncbi:putative BTB/POZ domain-containing protein [Acanthamoeba polyphaga mimivirus]|uniref:BTB/POZ domain-containing protein n=1 Tax=Acanthamoeba polyphaga mimivirus Kroon TaxID=3069720 RepID=A0A0G2Y4A3_9VIRU|nr:putative BTB/POZ domain-containing protein [Acanthamoeba polyphaga mimivirus]AKI80633.1 putative BTB/POZ domain-containing protein [Acanthamoeba polyphaga mimivirus Kroon]
MNYNKAYESVKANIFCDLELTINDGVNKLVTNVHKIILYSSCVYFEKLLTFGENYPNSIEILVPNTFVVYDIIMSFYGQKINSGNYPEWKIYLESYRCRDFLGLELDISDIKHLIVPEEGFELLLDIIELIGYNNETIRLLIKNLPEKYDLNKFPKELLSKILKLSQNPCCITRKNNCFYVYDIVTSNLIKSIPVKDINLENNYTFGNIAVSPNNNQIAYISERKNIIIQSLYNIKTSHIIKNKYHNSKISYSPDSKKLAFNTNKKIKIIDTESGKISNSFTCISKNQHKRRQSIYLMCYLNENEIIFIENYNVHSNHRSEIKIVNTTSGHHIRSILDCNYKIKSMCCSKKYLAIIGYGSYIVLLNLETNNSIHLKAHTKYIKDIYFNHDGKKLASISHDRTIIIWDVETGKILNTVPILSFYREEYKCGNNKTYDSDDDSDYDSDDDSDNDHNYDEYENDGTRYNKIYNSSIYNGNYPVFMCWTKYKNQILVSYNYSGGMLIDYTTLEIINRFKNSRQSNYYYFIYQNKNIVDRIKEIL